MYPSPLFLTATSSTSGAAYCRVKHGVSIPLSISGFSRANPKSTTLIWEAVTSSVSRSNRRFSGLMSLWTTPSVCM